MALHEFGTGRLAVTQSFMQLGRNLALPGLQEPVLVAQVPILPQMDFARRSNFRRNELTGPDRSSRISKLKQDGFHDQGVLDE
jgi:hypothetical protein